MMAKTEIVGSHGTPVLGNLRLNGKVEANEDNLVEIYPLVGGNVSK